MVEEINVLEVLDVGIGDIIEGWQIEEVELLDEGLVGVIMAKGGQRLYLRGVLGQELADFIVTAIEDEEGINDVSEHNLTFEMFVILTTPTPKEVE